MTRPAVIEHAIAFLHSKGIQLHRRDEAPWPHRMAWNAGMTLAPPAYATWSANLVILGGAFGLSWGVIVCAAMWLMDGALPPRVLVVVAATAISMGLVRAWQFHRLQRRIGLPTWEAFRQRHDAANHLG
jgi:hypothetical protein